MKRNWMATMVVAAGMGSTMFGQQYPQQSQYPQQDPRYQGDPIYNGDYGRDAGYGNGQQGVYAPAPPSPPRYAYNRSPMPGPGFAWVDGYWNFYNGRYSWVSGYWMQPPYAGGYWVAPRYSSGRFFLGFWGGGRQGYDRGFVRDRDDYRRPSPYSYGYRRDDDRGRRPEHREGREGHYERNDRR